jgi:hypothetical protein
MGKGHKIYLAAVVGCLLSFMAILSGGAALRESVTIDEVAHIAAGVSYLQKFDLRLNQEHPPLPKMVAAVPLLLRGTRTDYSHISGTASQKLFPAYLGEWVFGEWFLTKWNDPVSTLAWARLPMLLLTLGIGWLVFEYARRLGGNWGGLLCLSVYVSTPAFLAFGPLVHTDMAVTMLSLLTLWRFADLWKNPNRRNALFFALSLAGALLSKFTAGILFFAFVAFALSTRWRPVPGQPAEKSEARVWRRLRRRATLQGICGAALIVYIFYFVFSVNQPTEALYHIGHNWIALALRRLLFPPVLYFRGVFLVLLGSSRETFILGHSYPHGKWFYFPVLLLLKSSIGFLGLLLMVAVLALRTKWKARKGSQIIPLEFRVQWRVLWVGLIVFTGFCLLSNLDISIRHFSVPLVLLIILLSVLPRMNSSMWQFSLNVRRLTSTLVVVLVLSSILAAVRAYPFYFPFLNSLSFGHPGYALVNDSNLDWNQSLPEVKKFSEQHGFQEIALDEYGFNDPTAIVPRSYLWDCQMPTAAEAGQWVAVSANVILDGHNCVWLTHLALQPLAGGSMYAVHLPEQIPAAGSPQGPPLPAEFRQIAGAPVDMRTILVDVVHHPEKIPQVIEQMQAQYRTMKESGNKVPTDSQPK